MQKKRLLIIATVNKTIQRHVTFKLLRRSLRDRIHSAKSQLINREVVGRTSEWNERNSDGVIRCISDEAPAVCWIQRQIRDHRPRRFLLDIALTPTRDDNIGHIPIFAYNEPQRIRCLRNNFIQENN